MARQRKIDVLLEQVGRVEQLVDKLDRRVEKIELVTVIREPNSGLAADAYNGLRKQVVAAVTERNVHLHQLAQFDTAVRGEASTDHLGALVGEWLAQAGVQVVSDPQIQEAFQFVGDADGAHVRVVRPAYVDSVTGRVIQSGVAERLPAEHAAPVTDFPPAAQATTEPATEPSATDDPTPEPSDASESAAAPEAGSPEAPASSPDASAEPVRESDSEDSARSDNDPEATSASNQEQPK